jgi:hypothetical protein
VFKHPELIEYKESPNLNSFKDRSYSRNAEMSRTLSAIREFEEKQKERENERFS